MSMEKSFVIVGNFILDLFSAHRHNADDAVKYYVTKELIWPVLELATRTNPPNYATILELDRRIRALDIPQKLELTEDEKKNPTQGLRIREYVTMLYRPLCVSEFIWKHLPCNLPGFTSPHVYSQVFLHFRNNIGSFEPFVWTLRALGTCGLLLLIFPYSHVLEMFR